MIDDAIIAVDLGRLNEIRLDIEAYASRLAGLYEERLELFAALRARGVQNKDIGAAAGVTDVAVVQALRKARARAS